MNEKSKILIVDDSAMNREMLREILGEETYSFAEAEDGAEALEYLKRGEPADLMLLDLKMPRMDGFAVLEVMNEHRWTETIPVMMITAEADTSVMEHAYDLGAADYIPRPFDMATVRRRVANMLMLYMRQRKLAKLVTEQVYEKTKNNDTIINIFSHIVEFRNGESGSHVLHIRMLTDFFLRTLRNDGIIQMDEEEISRIVTASALHDIGKICIPDGILNKPGRLTDEEFEAMKQHTVVGADLLEKVPAGADEPLILAARAICRWHHERWDGRGYPDGLKGNEIPMSAQVVALADVYDALVSERCYKKAFSHETAVKMILNSECGVFNPVLMDCLRKEADHLPEVLQMTSEDLDYRREAGKLSDELFEREELPGTAQNHENRNESQTSN